VVAIIGILAAIAIPMFVSFQGRARTSKIQADLRAVMSAITAYNAQCNRLPAATADFSAAAGGATDCTAGDLSVLTAQQVIGGVSAGPFVTKLPLPPAGCKATGYSYGSLATGNFSTAYTSVAGDAAGCVQTTVQ